MDDDHTLDDPEEIIREARQASTRRQRATDDEASSTDDETIAVADTSATADAGSGPQYGEADDDETIDLDPGLLERLGISEAASTDDTAAREPVEPQLADEQTDGDSDRVSRKSRLLGLAGAAALVAALTVALVVGVRGCGGGPSPPIPAPPPPSPPPGIPELVVYGDEVGILAAWAADDNGSEIIEWEWESRGPGELDGPSSKTSDGHRLSNVPVGAYEVRVRARNAADWGPWSSWESVTVPDFPVPSLEAAGGASRVEASWMISVQSPRVAGAVEQNWEWSTEPDVLLSSPRTMVVEPYLEASAAIAVARPWIDELKGFKAAIAPFTGELHYQFEFGDVPVGQYDLKLRLNTRLGDRDYRSEWSNTVTVNVYGPPGQPTLSVRGGERRVEASWGADDNGSEIVEWEWESTGPSALEGPSSKTAVSHTLSDVAPGAHEVRVRARNSAGWGPWSSSEPLPLAPSKPTLSAQGGCGTLSVEWSADDSGSPIDRWRVEGFGELPGNSSDYIWRDLPPSSDSITVSARNSFGWSEPSEPASYRIVGAPGPPSVTANGGQNTATASWSANDNGSTILSWEVRDGGMPEGPSPTDTSYTWSGVSAGSYNVEVRATNECKEGNWGTAAVTVTQRPPSRPTITDIRVREDRDHLPAGTVAVSARWTANDFGSSIDLTEFQLETDPPNGGYEELHSDELHTWLGVPPGRYTVRIRVHNAGGWSPWGERDVTVACNDYWPQDC